MNAIVLLDTSIYLNVLDVPGRNQKREQILNEFEERVRCDDLFLLPMATIWETGNHISRLENGSMRWKYAQILAANVQSALNGEAPFRATYFPESSVTGPLCTFCSPDLRCVIVASFATRSGWRHS